ncbi:MAG: OprD family outer membrane porin [Thermodesulfobacteriota bacterium]
MIAKRVLRAAGNWGKKTSKMFNKFLGMMIMLATVSCVAILAWWIFEGSASAASKEESPAPDSVDEINTAIEENFQKQSKPKGFMISEILKEKLKDLPPFFRDMNFAIKPRTYFFYESKPNSNPPPERTIKEAWALGGSLAYESGLLLDRFAVGAELFTSQRLYGPEDHDGTELLAPGQHGYTVVGQLYGKLKLFDDHSVSFYRQEYDLPYVNKDDSKMTPNTFEGYTLQGSFGNREKGPELKYGGGYISRIKPQNSDEFEPMSVAAGASVERGTTMVGALFSFRDFSVGAINYYTPDIINIFYSEAKYRWDPVDGLGVLFTGQYTSQRSVGENLLTGSSFNVHTSGGKIEMSYGGAVLSGAFTNTSKGAAMLSPWGRYPGYTKMMISDFDQAGENTFQVCLSYDFKRLGLEGLSGYVRYAWGRNSINPSNGSPLPNQEEFDVTVDYRINKGFLRNFWIRLRNGLLWQQGTGKTYDFRAILNYDLAVF